MLVYRTCFCISNRSRKLFVEKTDIGGLLQSHPKDITRSYILPISLRHPIIGDQSNNAQRADTGRYSSDDRWHRPITGEFFFYKYPRGNILRQSDGERKVIGRRPSDHMPIIGR